MYIIPKHWTSDEKQFAMDLHDQGIMPALDYPLGAIVATAMLYDCMRTEYVLNEKHVSETEQELGNFESGRYAWLFRDIVELETPIPYKGAQGLFDIPDSIVNSYR